MLLIGAILSAIYLLPPPWGIAAVVAAALVELAEKAFWFRYSRRRPALVGTEAMIGGNARVVSDCLPNGLVRFRGELWQARCPGRALAGDCVRIGSVGPNLTLDVVPTRS